MSNQIENRIVEMEFDNKQFEDGVKESLSTLDKLKQALNFKDAGQNLDSLSKASKNFDLNGIGNAVEQVGDKFSTFRLLGIHALTNLVDAAMEAGKKITKALMMPINQAKTGGWNRAMNIEEAKFQLQGLGVAWEDIAEDIDFGVNQTAYGLDAAAKAAAQLKASGVEFGATFGEKGNSPMAHALRGISGVAAMTSSSYEEISQIFTKIAGQGRVYAQDLNSLAARGLNAAAIMAEQFGITETALREMVHDGEINFEIFSEAMYDAFGEHAVKANETFTGALENVKAALNKIGQPFATSVINGMIPILNQVRLFLNAIKANLGPVFDIFEKISKLVSNVVASKIADVTWQLENRFTGLQNINNALHNTFEAVLRVILAISDAFRTVFPASGGFVDFLNSAAEGAEKFSEKLLLDDASLNRLRNTVVVILTVLKAFFAILGKIFSIAGSILGVIFRLIGGLGNVISYIGNLIYLGTSLAATFLENLNLGEKIGKAFETIGRFITYLKLQFSDASTVLGKFANGLKYVGLILGALIAGPFYLIYSGISYLVEGLSNAANPIDFLKVQLVALGEKIKNVIAYLKELPVVGRVISVLEKAFNRVSKAIKNVTAWFKDIFDKIKSGQSLIDILKDKIGRLRVSVLTSKLEGVARVLDIVKKAALGLAGIIAGTVVKAFTEIKNLVDGFLTSKDPFGFLKQKIKEMITSLVTFITRLKEIPVLGTVITSIERAFIAVRNAIVGTYEWFKDFYNQVKEGASFFDVFKSKVTELGRSIKNALVDKVNEFLSNHQGLKATLDDIKIYATKAKDAIIDFALAIKEQVKSLNASKVILFAFAAMILVTVFNINELIIAIGGLTRKLSNGFFNIFKTAPTKWEKFITGLLGISAAIALIAGAFYMLKDVETDKLKEIAKTLGILVGMVAGISLLATVLVQLTARYGGGDGFMAFAANMFSLSAGVVILIGALKLMETLDMNGIWKRVAVLGAIVGGLVAVGVIMGRLSPKLTIGGLFMVAFAASTLLLVKALGELSTINLTNIKENWKELTVIIMAFGVFAAAASTVGVTSLLGLITFLVALKLLFKNYDAVKGDLEKTKIGETITKFAAKIKAEITQALQNIKNTYQAMSAFDKIMLAIYGIIAGGSIVLVTNAVSKASKNIRTAALSVTLLIAAMAGFMALFYYIADMSKSIPIGAVKQAQNVLMAIGGFILLLIAICSLGTDGVNDWGFEFKGKSRIARLARKGNISRANMTNNLAQMRKLITSVGFLLLAVAGFLLIVGQLSEAELKRASIALMGVMGFLSAIVIVSTFISNSTVSTGKAVVGFSSFIGLIALIATLIGSFVVLVHYFENFDFATKWPQLVAAIIGLGAVIAAVIVLTRTVTKFKGGYGLASIIGSIGVAVALIGGIITIMVKNIKPNEFDHAKNMAIMIGVFLGALMIFALALMNMSKGLANIRFGTVSKILRSLAVILGELIIAMVAFGAIAVILQKLKVDPGKMTAHFAILLLAIGGVVAMSVSILSYIGRFDMTKARFEKFNTSLIKFYITLAGLIAAVALFAGLAYLMRNMDVPKMMQQFIVLGVFLSAIVALSASITKFGQTTKGLSIGGLQITETIVILTALLYAIAGLFKLMDTLDDPWQSLKTVQSLVLILLELGALLVGCIYLGKVGKQAAAGVGMLSWMVGLLWTLVPIFAVIDTFKTKADRILGISQSIVLVLFELGGIAAACIALGYFVGLVAPGIGMLAIMVGLFSALVPLFVVIDSLKSKASRILGISQIIVLVLVELTLIASALGALVIAMVLGSVSAAALMPLITIFGILTLIFKVIDGMKTEGLLKKSQVIVLVLTELVALMSVMGALIIAMVLGSVSAIAMVPIILIFEKLVDIFAVLQDIKTEGITEKSNAVMKCLLKLVGVAAVMGILAPLAIAASFGTPAILAMCNAMVTIAMALRILDKVNADHMSKTIDLLTNALMKLAKIGIVGTIGGPGLAALAVGIDLLGVACALFGKGVKDFSEGLVNLANMTPAKIGVLVSTIKKFFESVGNGIVYLGKSITKAIVMIAQGVVTAINKMKETGPAFDFIFKMISKFIGVCKEAKGAVLEVLGVAKALEWLGIAIGLAGSGMGKFAEGVAQLAQTTPDQIENLKKTLEAFFSSLSEGIKVLGSGMREGFREAGNAILDLGQDITDSMDAYITLKDVLWNFIGMATVLALISPGLYELSIAIGITSVAIRILIGAFEKLANMSDSEIEQARKAITSFATAISENDKAIGQMITRLLELVLVFGLFSAIVTVFGPGLAGLAVMIITITLSIAVLSESISGLMDNINALANMTQEQTSNMQNVIFTFFDSISQGVAQLGTTIVQLIIEMGAAIAEAINYVINALTLGLLGGKPQVTDAAGQLGTSIDTGFNQKIGDPFSWGLHIVEKIASGLFGGIPKVASAAASVATSIANYLKNSNDPKSGPLSNISEWGGHMVQKIATGILGEVPSVDAASATTAQVIDNNLGTGSRLSASVGANADSIANSFLAEIAQIVPGVQSYVNQANAILGTLGSQEIQVDTGSGVLGQYRYQLKSQLGAAQREYKKARINELAGIDKVAGKNVGKNYYANQAAEAKKKVDEYNQALKELDGTAQKAAASQKQFGEGAEAAAKGAGGAASQMKDFTSELTGVLEGQMDIFSKFEKKSAMSKAELLENMRSQIAGMADWANQMNSLAAKGIDQGLYEKLAMMGPQGAEYVGAFNEMTAEELAEANQLWGQSLVLPSAVAKSVSASFSTLGTGIVGGLIQGLDGSAATATDYIAAFGDECYTAFHDSALRFGSPSHAMEDCGRWIVEGLKNGITKNSTSAFIAMRNVANEITRICESNFEPSKFRKYGVNIINGIADGLNDSGARSRLDSILSELNSRIQEITAKMQQIRSPSRVFYGFGKYIVEGLANGIKDYTRVAEIATEDMSYGVLDTMKETIRQIGTMLEEEIEEPVITPVLDLTNVQAGAKQLNSMFTTNQAMSALSSMNDLQNGQLNDQNAASKLGTTFIQNNYSPKALNRMEIYRQTRNQFSQYKEAMQ